MSLLAGNNAKYEDARKLIETSDPKAWRHHKLGVLQHDAPVDYANNARVHIWHPSLCQIDAGNVRAIHDHRYDLRSTVLYGMIENVEYDVEMASFIEDKPFRETVPMWAIVHAKEQKHRKVMPRVYLAGPIGKDPGVMSRVLDALSWANTIAALDCAVYVPHLAVHWHHQYPRPYEAWMDDDFEWITACDALIRMPGHSPGADREVEFALGRGTPVFYGLAGAPGIAYDSLPVAGVIVHHTAKPFHEWRKAWKRVPDDHVKLIGHCTPRLRMPQPRTIYRANDSYEVPRHNFHRTTTDGLTITYVERNGFSDHPARILGEGASGIVQPSERDEKLITEVLDAARAICHSL